MRMQDSQANCGPASMSNALAAVGLPRSQDECAALCKTTGTDGTSARKILVALRAVGRAPVPINEQRQLVALLQLEEALRTGRPVILCVDGGSHWVAAIGLLGHRLLVADPADNDLVLSYSRADLLVRWEDGTRYYGVVV